MKLFLAYHNLSDLTQCYTDDGTKKLVRYVITKSSLHMFLLVYIQVVVVSFD